MTAPSSSAGESRPLEPDHDQRLTLGHAAVDFVDTFIAGRADAPAVPGPLDEAVLGRLLQPPPEQGRDVDELFGLIEAAGNDELPRADGLRQRHARRW